MADLKVIQWLESKKNIAELLDEDVLKDLGSKCITGFDIDEESRAGWLESYKNIENLAMQTLEEKNFPFSGASNVKYPLLSTAAIQFSARAMPTIMRGPDIVRAKVIGSDTDGKKASRAARVSAHMSYQCSNEMEEWEDEMDKLLTILPYPGCAFKRTYFSSLKGRNVSEFVSPKNLSMHYLTKKMEIAPRVTFIYELYENEIEERKRNGMFLDLDFGTPSSTHEDEDERNDPDRPHIFLEQYTWIDLDDDGYKEPYTVTIHKDTEQVARIMPRFMFEGIKTDGNGKILKIEPIHHITQYLFMVSPDGGSYGFGFGNLLYPINETVNTTTNQLLDAGTRASAQSGFLGNGIQLGKGRSGGNITIGLNEWKPVGYIGDDLRKNIFPLPTKDPSNVLFSLLEFFVDAGKQVASVSEILTGDQSIHNEPATTTLARIEQGLKLFSQIYKRVYRALKSEFKKLYILNGQYLEPTTYFRVLDDEKAIARTDYLLGDLDIVPVADPSEISETQKLLKAQMLFSLKGQGFNDEEIDKRYLEALQIDDIEKIMPKEKAPPPVDPKIEVALQTLDLERDKFEFDQMKFAYESAEIESKIVKNLASAEAAEEGPQLEKYKIDAQVLIAQAKEKSNANNGTGTSGVAKSSGNKGSSTGS